MFNFQFTYKEQKFNGWRWNWKVFIDARNIAIEKNNKVSSEPTGPE